MEKWREQVRISLYEHNRKAYEAVLRMMNAKGKAAIIHPTGTGKSFIGFKLAEEHPSARVCWLSPSEYIFKTQLENLTAAGSQELNNIQFLTYTKLMLTEDSLLAELKPDYIVLDEFHQNS